MCVSRLRSLRHKLRNEPNLLSDYDKIIQQQCGAGIVERVPKSNCAHELSVTSVHSRGGGGGGETPIWKGRGCSSEILNLTPKRDQSGRGGS